MQKFLSALLPGILFAIFFFHIVGALVLGHGYDALTYTTMACIGWTLAFVLVDVLDADADAELDEDEGDFLDEEPDTSGEG